ncbi:MAG: hypothetical protein ACK5RL_21015 [Acidimicrobiales bacterium]
MYERISAVHPELIEIDDVHRVQYRVDSGWRDEVRSDDGWTFEITSERPGELMAKVRATTETGDDPRPAETHIRFVEPASGEENGW